MKHIYILIAFSFFIRNIIAQEKAPFFNENINLISSVTFDLKGRTLSKSVNYFNSLGRSIQQQEFDVLSKKIWGSEILYDANGRFVLQTYVAPINISKFLYQSDFFSFTSGTELDDYSGAVSSLSPLAKYYSESNIDNKYQDVTDYPFTSVKYSRLNPGEVLENYGGNKIEKGGKEQWAQTYSFSMPVGNGASLKKAFDKLYLDTYGFTKTIVRDIHGVESVVFKDVNGNIIAAARSGNEEGVNNILTSNTYKINEIGFVDIHIPKGVSKISYVLGGGATGLNVINLIEEKAELSFNVLNNPGINGKVEANIAPGMYRLRVQNSSNYKPDFSKSSGYVEITAEDNYYDYSLNEYDVTNRLTSAKQPLAKLESTYKYNSLNQLLETESVDEGKARFVYRDDGQIRFSQNAKQKVDGDLSYTEYDNYGRPIESGVVLSAGDIDFYPASTPPILYIRKSLAERQYTKYDIADNNKLQLAFGSDIRKANYEKQQFVAGAVSKTYSDNSTTWYSYDVQGRVTWTVQKIRGLNGVKTIDYEYDFATGQVAKVFFQKGVSTEQFIHKYTYNIKGQLTKVETSTNNSTFKENAEYKYAETGELIRTELEGNLQGIDYVYNLNGQLKAINHPSLNKNNDPGKDGVSNGFKPDVFGFAIDYHKNDYLRTNTPTPVKIQRNFGTDQFNGNIKNVRWNTKSLGATNKEKVYSYKYNKNNWLTQADYGEFKDGTVIGNAIDDFVSSNKVFEPSSTLKNIVGAKTVTLSPGFHAKKGSTLAIRTEANPGFDQNSSNDYQVSNITYDANGNIQSLKRNKSTVAGNNQMDDLTYQYKSDKPNQLERVDDTVTRATNASDIKDQNGDNYEYNEIGQLVINHAENIEYVYNTSGLVTKVIERKDLGGGNISKKTIVEFEYNERGQRVRKQFYGSQGFIANTYYVRDVAGTPMAIYNNSSVSSLTLREHPVYGATRLGVYKRQNGQTNYELTDHLGNVRAVVSKEDSNTLKSAADYYPFGMQMPLRNSLSDYRYAYQGQEKDPETGKEAFQLRLWDARIGRWLRPDPYLQYHSPYLGIGNIPTSAFDLDGGYVYIMGANDKLLRVFNKVMGTELGIDAVGFFINNPNSHVIISSASAINAGGLTASNGRFQGITKNKMISKRIVNNILKGFSIESAYKYRNHYNSFEGGVLQKGNNYLISVDLEDEDDTSGYGLTHLEAAFHEIYAHAYAKEALGISKKAQHSAFAGTETGRFDSWVNNSSLLGPSEFSFPISRFFNSDIFIRELSNGVNLNNYTPNFNQAGSLIFGKILGGATKVEQTQCPCINPRNF